jgi:hypothetical protein
VPLPTYPFDRRRHWVDLRPAGTAPAPAPLAMPANGHEPEADEAAETAEGHVAPSSELEVLISEVWQQHFGLSRPIGVTENFFALGGQSLLAVELASVLRGRLNLPVSLATVFQHPTVYELAQAIATMRGDEPAAPDAAEALLAEIESLSDEEAAARLQAESAG